MSLPYVIETDDKGDKSYEIYSRLLKDRIIFIKGTFDDEMANGVVAQLLFLQSADPEKDIQMYINSPGGSITSMYAIYDTMQYVSPDIVTIGLGCVASAGSFILAAGTKGKRQVLGNTEIMIHELAGGMHGKHGDLAIEYKRMQRLHEKMAHEYKSFTGQSLKKIKADMERDYWMTAQEAKDYGLIDEVITKK